MTELSKAAKENIANHIYDYYLAFVANKYGAVLAPHIEKLSTKLENLFKPEYPNRLCVAMPPQHSKSSIVTLAFSSWLICNNPDLRILIVNAEKELSTTFGIQIRNLLYHASPYFDGLKVSNVKSSSTHLMFEKNGELCTGEIRLTGASGSITGHPADIVIVDDPYKGLEDEFTPTQLRKKWNWYTNLIEQRLRGNSKLVLLHTRWHSEDIQGQIKADEYQRSKYEFIEFPAINDQGEPLWPEYYDKEFYLDKQKTMGERQFQAIYQQQPLDLTSDYFHLDKLHWDDTYIDRWNIANCRSYDMAYTSEKEALDKNKNADYTAGCHAEKISENHYIFSDFLYKRLGEKNINYIQATARYDGISKPILIEPGTKGGAAKELFRLWDKDYLPEYKCIQSEPIGSKADRATALANAMYDGKIHIYCPDPVIRKELKLQLESFPLGSAHKDLIDCMAHAYNYLKDKKDNRNRNITSTKRHGRRNRRI